MLRGSQVLPARWINSEVINRPFLCPPGKFESSQTVIFEVGSTKMQLFSAFLRQNLNAMPHNKVVSAELLKALFRGPVLIKSILSEAEKNRNSNHAITIPCKDNETETGLDDMLVDV